MVVFRRILYTSPKNTFQKLHFRKKHLPETTLTRVRISLNVHLPKITFPRRLISRNFTCHNLHFPENLFSRIYTCQNLNLAEITFPRNFIFQKLITFARNFIIDYESIYDNCSFSKINKLRLTRKTKGHKKVFSHAL